MNKTFVERFMANKSQLESDLASKHPNSYKELVHSVFKVISSGDYGDPDPSIIHEIDDGDYQGNLLYLVPEKAYQPSNYFFVLVAYGSCSGCDILEGIREYAIEKPTKDQVSEYMDLALHIVQGIKPLGGEK
jgi:hypothetical protein